MAEKRPLVLYSDNPIGFDELRAGDSLPVTAADLGAEVISNKSTNTSLGTSDTLYPSQKAVKAYVDARAPIYANYNYIPGAGTTVNNSYAGYSFRQLVPANVFLVSAGHVRITVKGPGSNTLVIDHMSIVPASASPPNGTTTPTEIKFGGLSGCSLGVGAWAYSDWIAYSWVYSVGNLIISDIHATGTQKHVYTTPGGWTDYYKAGTTSWDQQNVSDFSAWTNDCDIVYNIELAA